ncbi:hypothetical protein [Microbacterium cremeum]|uniref:hypothetical protein n=1 Tax=Microbacterium cremeum TaxID=2782169 RepID=UPI0018874035|nr:hypothetical protein [Microbacterium cremeum]
MTPGDQFGPTGVAASGAPPFAVAGPTQLALDASRSGAGSFTVSNVTGRPVRARLLVTPGAGADASWFAIGGGPERALPLAGTATVEVAVTVPGDVAAGAYSFTVGAALEEAPDQVVPGPTVALTVPAAQPRRFPWWIVIVAAVALLLLVGGGILIWILTRPGPQPEPTPADTGPPVLRTDELLMEFSPLDLDLDLDGVQDLTIFDADLNVVPFDRPTTVFGLMRGVAIVDDPRFEVCREVFLQESVDIADAAATTFVCVFTSEGHAGLLEIGATGADQTRTIAVTVWE